MKNKIKKRKFIFDRKIQNINITSKELQSYEVVPGYSCDLPELSYEIITNISILVAINTILTKFKDKNFSLKKIELIGKNDNMIIIKSNYQDYFDFTQAFVLLLDKNIENIQLED